MIFLVQNSAKSAISAKHGLSRYGTTRAAVLSIHHSDFFSFLVPAIAANQKGDNNDDINDSGMDTMYFQDSPEKEDFNRTAEVLGPRPGKGALDQLLCMKN